MRAGWIACLMAVSCRWAVCAPGGLDARGLVGLWRGLGALLEVDRERPSEPLAFDLSVDEALHGQGRVGGAVLREWTLAQGSRPLRITARLEGVVHPEPARNKGFLILLVTEIRMDRLHAEFALVADPGFDPTACRGRVVLNRVRPIADPPRPATPTRAPRPPA